MQTDHNVKFMYMYIHTYKLALNNTQEKINGEETVCLGFTRAGGGCTCACILAVLGSNCAVSEDNHLASTFLNALRSSDRKGHGGVKADKAGLQSAYSIRFPFGPDADRTKPNFSLYLLGY